MLIREIGGDNDITINVSNESKTLQLSTTTLAFSIADSKEGQKVALKNGYHNFIAAKVLSHDGKILNFDSDSITCDVIAIHNNKPHIWSDVKILRVNLPDAGNAYLVLSDDNVRPINRRNEFRVFLGCDGVCYVNQGKQPMSVIVKDVSCSGIGLVGYKQSAVEFKTGMPIEVRFSEQFNNSVSHDYNVLGKIVRYADIDDNKFLLGCKLFGDNRELAKMIYARQRRTMSVNNAPQIQRETSANLLHQLESMTNNK